MTDHSTTDLSKTSENIPLRPESAEYQDKPCADCGLTVKPRFWPGIPRSDTSIEIRGHWYITAERCPACENKHKDKLAKEDAERRRRDKIDRYI